MDTPNLNSGQHMSERFARANVVIERCRRLALVSDIQGETTRTFLSPAMRMCMHAVQSWMEAAGMSVTTDAAGNLRGLYPGRTSDAPRLLIGSHLDTVPNAGAFDGVLGVMLGLALIESLNQERLSFAIELIGFSEEEGVRFKLPFIGSRALVGRFDPSLLSSEDSTGISLKLAIEAFGLDPDKLGNAILHANSVAYLEFHIEQGIVLESRDLSLGVVDGVAGQTRGEMRFLGHANHAGTTPMSLRRDAMSAAAQWICELEQRASSKKDLMATVGRIQAFPGAGNVIAGEVLASLDIRHPDDGIRREFVNETIASADSIAMRRGLKSNWKMQLEQPAVRMDARLTELTSCAIAKSGIAPLRMISGAGHDAMIVAERLPAAMIFVRSPGGISHHPDETVREEDIENALTAGLVFLKELQGHPPISTAENRT
ncbi:MAG TPA: allantoate amidohydrolase [Acidobacteriaceae bacterium]